MTRLRSDKLTHYLEEKWLFAQTHSGCQRRVYWG